MLQKKDLLGLIDLTAEEITELLDVAEHMKEKLKAIFKKTFAVLRPIPGNVINVSKSLGTFP